MAPYTFELFAPYNKQAGLRLKNASARMFVSSLKCSKNKKKCFYEIRVLIFPWNSTKKMVIGVQRLIWPMVNRSYSAYQNLISLIGIYHYQYKIITQSWFEKEPEPAVLDYINGEIHRECLSFFSSLFYTQSFFVQCQMKMNS
jgi:hypothetical protein